LRRQSALRRLRDMQQLSHLRGLFRIRNLIYSPLTLGVDHLVVLLQSCYRKDTSGASSASPGMRCGSQCRAASGGRRGQVNQARKQEEVVRHRPLIPCASLSLIHYTQIPSKGAGEAKQQTRASSKTRLWVRLSRRRQQERQQTECETFDASTANPDDIEGEEH
jgi:hypothetical protein